MRSLSAEFLTDDIPGTADFYGTLLGLPLQMSDNNTLAFGAGRSRLLFRRSTGRNPVYHFAFNIPENQAESAYDYYAAKVDMIPFGEQDIVDFQAWNAHSFYFTDNNGNILEMIARHDLPNARPLPFRPSAISGVSEVAVCTADVHLLCSQFENQSGITHYTKQPPHHNFAAMGDAEGLLIVSARGRHWFPTETEARPFPVKIKIMSGNMIRSLAFNSPAGDS
jgi:catechol 2,3-dioxygenase-like lactoylglutathione lyase family enzyme